VLGSTGAAVPFYDLTFSATKSVSLLQASFAAIAAAARKRGDTATADEFEAKVKAIDDAAVETAAQVVATRRCTESTFENFTLSTSDCPSESADVHRFPLRVAVLTVTAVLAARGRGPGARREEDGNKQVPKISLALQ
jgi:hypothetical protein